MHSHRHIRQAQRNPYAQRPTKRQPWDGNTLGALVVW
jgi:hypothetical protein